VFAIASRWAARSFSAATERAVCRHLAASCRYSSGLLLFGIGSYRSLWGAAAISRLEEPA
jgi:hypothetical protein